MQEVKQHIAKKKLVPQLRFKEFDGECSRRVYSDLVKVIDCKHRTPLYVEEGIPLVSPGTIKWGEIDLVSPTKRVTEEEYESLMDHCSPTIGDLVFSRNQSIGVASYLKKDEKFVLGQDTVLIQSKEIDSGYNYFCLQTFSVQSLIDRLSGGSTFARINLGDLRKLKIIVAKNLTEQQKIASFLSAVDEKIQQLTKKKELLEQYKKGVMQKLFSGELRFKDENGKDYPGWEEKRLGKIFEERNEKGFIDMELLSISIKGGVYNQSESNKIDNSNSDKGKYKRILKGDIGYNSMRMWQGASAVSSLDGIISPAYTVLRSNENSCSEYFGFLFKMTKMIQTFQKHSQGLTSDTWNLKYPMISKIKVMKPCFEEQQKIATYLSSIDTKIESVNQQITQTQTFKKGLLQQMFV